MDLIEGAGDRFQWQDFVNTLMNFINGRLF
jgi:hypothetical protein